MVVRTGRFYAVLVLVVLAGATALRIYDPFFLQAVRFIAFDSFQRLEPQAYDPGLPVRVVDIDEDSLERIGQWPWSRETMARLLAALAGQGAAVVAFDILFSESDRSASAGAAAPPAASPDAAFAAAIAAAPTVLATALTNRVDDTPGLPAKAGFAVAGDDPRPFIAGFLGATANLPAFDAAAAGIGSINWIPDRDQVVRRIPLVYRLGEDYVPTLTTEALRVAQGASTYLLKASNASGETAFGQATGLNHVKVGSIEIPTDPDGGIWMQFRPSNPATFIPAWKVLAGENDPGGIEGQIVLVGTSAPGLIDLRATPLDASIPGVEIHAQAIEHILSGLTLTRPDYALAAELALVILLGLVIAFLLPRVPPLAAAGIGVVAVAGILAAGWWLYVGPHLLFDPSYPAMALAFLVGVATLHIYRRVEKQRAEVRRAFGLYVAPAVVDEIVRNPGKLELGGEVRELSLMFCDVRNFTGIAERLNAHELTRFINALLTPLSAVILAHRGTIDKYMGDAIMAFWNAPLDDRDHAPHACRAALKMIAAMEGLNATWRAEARAAGRDFSRVTIGIGINTAECCVGNLGSVQRFDYSAIGDGVNIASRFEGLSKLYGVPVVVGEPTVERAPGIAVLELDLIRVKGRGQPTRVFTLLDGLGLDGPRVERLKPLHAEMLRRFRARDWPGTEEAIRGCRAVGAEALETYYVLFRTRALTYRDLPPPDEWDGADTALTK